MPDDALRIAPRPNGPTRFQPLRNLDRQRVDRNIYLSQAAWVSCLRIEAELADLTSGAIAVVSSSGTPPPSAYPRRV